MLVRAPPFSPISNAEEGMFPHPVTHEAECAMARLLLLKYAKTFRLKPPPAGLRFQLVVTTTGALALFAALPGIKFGQLTDAGATETVIEFWALAIEVAQLNTKRSVSVLIALSLNIERDGITAFHVGE
jgi:hypothetical protein